MSDLQTFFIEKMEPLAADPSYLSAVTSIPKEVIEGILNGSLKQPTFTIEQIKKLCMAFRVNLFNFPNGEDDADKKTSLSKKTKSQP